MVAKRRRFFMDNLMRRHFNIKRDDRPDVWKMRQIHLRRRSERRVIRDER